jgi:predicted ATPase
LIETLWPNLPAPVNRIVGRGREREEVAALLARHRLGDRFRLLSGGPRTAEPRQRTLRAALDWSYALLGEPERTLMARLAVFAGGWTLGAAEAVCASADLETWLIVDLLDALVNRSLASMDGERYRLPETVRQYAWERLEEASEAATLRERHLAWCVALAEEADVGLHGPEQGRWLACLDGEYDNMRAALDWSVYHGAMGAMGARLAAALSLYWEQRGHLAEGWAWLEAAGAGGADPGVRARALAGAG